eukprot:COSAG01_NODE_6855_length_3468_cov_11.336302_2_plen_54_part_00
MRADVVPDEDDVMDSLTAITADAGGPSRRPGHLRTQPTVGSNVAVTIATLRFS